MPDIPVRVIVVVRIAALAAAVRVRFCARPGVSVRVDGLADTPEGNPLRDTLTLPVNPFSAFAVTETCFPVAPAVRLRLVGATVSEKSRAGAAEATVRPTVAVWVRAPDAPVTVMVSVLAVAEASAVKVRFCAMPGVSVRVDGLAVTPAGNPLQDSETDPVNPLRAVAVTETDFPVAPAVRVRVVGATVSEKSGAGAAAVTVSAMGAV